MGFCYGLPDTTLDHLSMLCGAWKPQKPKQKRRLCGTYLVQQQQERVAESLAVNLRAVDTQLGFLQVGEDLGGGHSDICIKLERSGCKKRGLDSSTAPAVLTWPPELQPPPPLQAHHQHTY